MPVILATWEAEMERMVMRGQPGQIVLQTPISNITRAKWTGSVVQAVEHLLCKSAILSSSPIPRREREREKEREREREREMYNLYLFPILSLSPRVHGDLEKEEERSGEREREARCGGTHL
jgi:hypothetical protein